MTDKELLAMCDVIIGVAPGSVPAIVATDGHPLRQEDENVC